VAEFKASLLEAICQVWNDMVSEVMQLFLMDEEMYSRTGSSNSLLTSPSHRRSTEVVERRPGVATRAIDALLRSHIFPTIPKLLQCHLMHSRCMQTIAQLSAWSTIWALPFLPVF
jgi:hypothetical protein